MSVASASVLVTESCLPYRAAPAAGNPTIGALACGGERLAHRPTPNPTRRGGAERPASGPVSIFRQMVQNAAHNDPVRTGRTDEAADEPALASARPGAAADTGSPAAGISDCAGSPCLPDRGARLFPV